MLFFLLAGDIIVLAAHIFLREKLGFFDLDVEGNLASLYSGAKLWFVATLAVVNALILWHAKTARRSAVPWFLFAAGVAYIGLDDMMGVHERIGFVLNNLLGTGGFYGESFNWLLYFAPFMIAAVIVFTLLFRTLWRGHRRAAWWFGAGVLLWIGSIGVEFLGRDMILAATVNVSRYHLLIIMEETLELLGATAFALTLAHTLKKTIREHVEIKKT